MAGVSLGSTQVPGSVVTDAELSTALAGKVAMVDLNEWVSDPMTSWSTLPTRASLIPAGFTGRLVLDCGSIGPRTIAGDAAVAAVLLDGDDVIWPALAPVA